MNRIMAISVAIAALVTLPLSASAAPTKPWKPGKLRLISKQMLDQTPPYYRPVYVNKTGVEMIGYGGRSMDNGRTWAPFTPTPSPLAGLPDSYRRSPNTAFRDPVNGLLLQIILALDVKTDPNVDEPPVGDTHYYLRYRVSADKGATYLFDEPIFQKGYTVEHPFPTVWTGKNGLQLGDAGNRPIRTRKGNIILPAECLRLGDDGKLANPGGSWSYCDGVIIIGKWRKDKRIDWFTSSLIVPDPVRTTRGLNEPTIAEMPDGRILLVARGSNGGSKDPNYKLPAYRWHAVSRDGGFTWSGLEPWTYDTGEPFFSPCAMSELFTHSNGRTYWIGNISDTNCRGNMPRYPLWIVEVNPKSLLPVKSTLTMIDTLQPEDTEGVNLAHHFAYEDRENHDIVIPMHRFNGDYTKSKPVVYRIGVD